MSNMQCTLLTLCVIFLNEYILVAVKQMFSTRFLLDVDLTGLASSSSVDAAPLAIYTEVLFTSLSLVPSVWPHLFRGAGHEKRRGEQMKWSLAFRLCIVSFPCAQLPGPVHTARLGRVCFHIQPRLVFCVFVLL